MIGLLPVEGMTTRNRLLTGRPPLASAPVRQRFPQFRQDRADAWFAATCVILGSGTVLLAVAVLVMMLG